MKFLINSLFSIVCIAPCFSQEKYINNNYMNDSSYNIIFNNEVEVIIENAYFDELWRMTIENDTFEVQNKDDSLFIDKFLSLGIDKFDHKYYLSILNFYKRHDYILSLSELDIIEERMAKEFNNKQLKIKGIRSFKKYKDLIRVYSAKKDYLGRINISVYFYNKDEKLKVEGRYVTYNLVKVGPFFTYKIHDFYSILPKCN